MKAFDSIGLVAFIAALSVTLPTPAQAAGKYWWQNDKSAFGSPSGNSAAAAASPNGGWNSGQAAGAGTAAQPAAAAAPQPPPRSGGGGGCSGGGGGYGGGNCGGGGGSYNNNPTPAFPAPAANNFRPAPNSNSNFQPAPVANNNFQNVPVNNNNRGQAAPNQRQPQQPQVITTGSCPRVDNLPPVEFCSGKSSNCWSVGQPDTDCVGNALCCFDGCGNTCYYGGGSGNGAPNNNQGGQSNLPQNPQVAQQQPNIPASNQRNNQVTVAEQPIVFPAVPPNHNQQKPVNPQTKPATRRQQQQSQGYPRPQQPKPQQKRPQRPQQQAAARPAPPSRQQSQPRPQQQQPRPQQQQPRPQQQQPRPQQQQNNFGNAELKPYVRCPSAMLCVKRENCDFHGVITEQTYNLTPDLEMLRVPLIPCVNAQDPLSNGNVCCRDPNYVDPWPNMKNMRNMKNNNRQNMMNNNNNNRQQQQD